MDGDWVEVRAWLSGRACRAELWLYSASHSRAEVRFCGNESRSVVFVGVQELRVRVGSSSGAVQVSQLERGVAVEAEDFLLVADSVHWLAHLSPTVDPDWLRRLVAPAGGPGDR